MEKNSPITNGTDIQNVLLRGRSIFLGLFTLFVIALVATVYTGMQSGEINKKVIAFQKNLQDLQKALEPLPTPTPIVIKQYPTPTDESTPTPTAAPVQRQQQIIYYTYPTSTPFPTVVPGQPGSKEWDANFQKQWDQMTQQNAAMQKQVEDAQKDFCNKNPTLCNK